VTNHGLSTTVVVLAGGSGTRVGLGMPKQLLKVAGKTVIEHTMDVLQSCGSVDSILVVMSAEWIGRLRHILGSKYPKIAAIVAGGHDRNESTRLALEALGDGEQKVLFHDAVRPFVSPGIIDACVDALDRYDAVDVVIPSSDTIVVVDADDQVTDIPDRSRLRRGQTPQGFTLSCIRGAYRNAALDPSFTATDDCSVVLKYLPGTPIGTVLGSEENLKITHPLDLFVADKLFQLGSTLLPERPTPSTPAVADKTVVVFGGSYGIGHEIVLQARESGAQAFSFSRSDTGTDVRDPAGIEAALQQAYEMTGRIDAVVVSAAVLSRGPLVEMSVQGIVEQLEVNLLAPSLIARAALPYLSKTQGHLVLFTSSSYTRGRAEYSLYSAAKAAVVNLAQALADEWSDLKVQVNCVNPERTKTPMRTLNFGDEPPGSLLSPDEVAKATLELLASGVTGMVIDVRRDPS
jgi:2-C-methyl-D-erythritol 4-phosphate cytidylyltransferase